MTPNSPVVATVRLRVAPVPPGAEVRVKVKTASSPSVMGEAAATLTAGGSSSCTVKVAKEGEPTTYSSPAGCWMIGGQGGVRLVQSSRRLVLTPHSSPSASPMGIRAGNLMVFGDVESSRRR